MTPLARAVEAAFAGLARWRSARAVHPRGVVVRGHLEVDGRSATGIALGGPWSRPVLGRVSKSAGTPGRLPDVLGVALRVEAPPGPVDLLFATAGRHRLVHFVLAPAASWWSRPYSTLLPYRVDGRIRFLGLHVEATGDASPRPAPACAAADIRRAPRALVLTERSFTGPARPAGRLVLDAVPAGPPPVSFDPVLNASSRFRPVRLLRGVREWAYTGSRRARGAPEPAGAGVGVP